ncbi:MAG: hypothetical protein ACOYOK_00695 [Pseudobdellovibrionaceae bacterium]
MLLSGCATYQSKVASARDFIEQKNFSAAIDHLEPLAKEENKDQLVYLLDYAVALQLAGRIEDSNRSFLLADRLVEQMDYHSVTKVTSSLLLNEEMVQYKGDTFEKIFIHAYLAMNFLDLQKLDEALVEARQINENYKKYQADSKTDIRQISFGKYLSAIIWEASQQYDDAYIAFQESYKLDPSISGIEKDLLRTAKLSRRDDAYNKWLKNFGHLKSDSIEKLKSNEGELIVLYQQGWGPRKNFNPNNSFAPRLASTFSKTQTAELSLNELTRVKSYRVYDVDRASKQTLEADQASLVAKRIGALAAKEIAADQIRQKNQVLGLLTWVTLHASERADLRQWSTLPESVQIIRVRLPVGSYNLQLQGLDGTGQPTGEKSVRSIEIKNQKTSFWVWRSVK